MPDWADKLVQEKIGHSLLWDKIAQLLRDERERCVQAALAVARFHGDPHTSIDPTCTAFVKFAELLKHGDKRVPGYMGDVAGVGCDPNTP